MNCSFVCSWQPIEQAAGLLGGLAGLEQELDQAVANNLTVIRAFGYVVQEGWNMQISTGVYNESLLVRSSAQQPGSKPS